MYIDEATTSNTAPTGSAPSLTAVGTGHMRSIAAGGVGESPRRLAAFRLDISRRPDSARRTCVSTRSGVRGTTERRCLHLHRRRMVQGRRFESVAGSGEPRCRSSASPRDHARTRSAAHQSAGRQLAVDCLDGRACAVHPVVLVPGRERERGHGVVDILARLEGRLHRREQVAREVGVLREVVP